MKDRHSDPSRRTSPQNTAYPPDVNIGAAGRPPPPLPPAGGGERGGRAVNAEPLHPPSVECVSMESKDFRERALRRVKEGLGRLCRRKSVTITEYDPSFKVLYLGNVLTPWAKGDGCIEKPLNTLWKNYQSSCKPDVQMKVTVTQSGLKAVTKEHGLTEYWSHRITYCSAPPAYPRVFCWVYRHEGRKLKQELRCHAVLCNKESTARRIAQDLSFRLAQALIEFKRDKLSKQNARLSLANAVYDNPSLPRRKILLSTGSQNYRPPLERSKSAPKLMSIEESLEEEEESEIRRSFRTRMRVPHQVSFTDDVWGKDGVHISGEFDAQEEFKGFDEPGEEKEEKVILDPAPQRERKLVTRRSWAGENITERLCLSDLPRDPTDYMNDVVVIHKEAVIESDILNSRKKLLESLLDPGVESLEVAFTKLYPDLDYLEEESTPSLQSISSGSDTCRTVRQCDLDSLSEEDSDESGFAEVSDDKIRDLPHHHLVKPCLLPTQAASLQV